MKTKKSRLGAFQANVSNKLSHIYNIAANLHREIRQFYDSPDFHIAKDLPCLSDDFEEYGTALAEIQDRCSYVNSRIEGEIKACQARIGQSRSQQQETYADIMRYVQEKLA